MAIYDVTHPVSERTAVWPGDTPFQLLYRFTMAGGAAANVGTVILSTHTGTHADAPYHYQPAGATAADLDLGAFVGRARLVHLPVAPAIRAAHLADLDLRGVERLLLRTGSNPDPERFQPGFTWLEPAAVAHLGDLGVRLLGTDAPSVDPWESADLPAHRACGRRGIFILENLNLAGLFPGDYELIALPLRLAGADATPVRAVLRDLPDGLVP